MIRVDICILWNTEISDEIFTHPIYSEVWLRFSEFLFNGFLCVNETNPGVAVSTTSTDDITQFSLASRWWALLGLTAVGWQVGSWVGHHSGPPSALWPKEGSPAGRPARVGSASPVTEWPAPGPLVPPDTSDTQRLIVISHLGYIRNFGTALPP